MLRSQADRIVNATRFVMHRNLKMGESDMFITREADYGIRTIRALSSGQKLNITAICEQEKIPRQFAYKILKKLNCAEIVSIIRGVNGGYVLTADLEKLSLYDIISAIDEDLFITKCMDFAYDCEQDQGKDNCRVHQEFMRIQKVVEEELKKTPVSRLV